MSEQKGLVVSKRAEVLAAFPGIQTIGQAFEESGMFPGIKKAQAVVKIMAGQELGFPPVFSMMNIDIVLGRVRLNSQVLAALVKRDSVYDYQVKEHSEKVCILSFTKKGSEVYESTFSIADAQRAGLVKAGSGWMTYPKAMLFARALSQGAKIVCPHLIAGASTLEDEGLEEVDGEITKEGEPLPSTWRAFWAETKDLGLTEEQVHEILEVVSVKDWLEQGKSLEEAIGKLKASQVTQDIAELYGSEGQEGSEKRATPQTPSVTPAADPSEILELKGQPAIDISWLKESLTKLGWLNDAAEWLKLHYKIKSTQSIRAMVLELTPAQQAEFAREVRERLIAWDLERPKLQGKQ